MGIALFGVAITFKYLDEKPKEPEWSIVSRAQSPTDTYTHTRTYTHSLSLTTHAHAQTHFVGVEGAESREDFAQDLFSRLELIEGRG